MKNELTDKERILMTVVDRLSRTQILCHTNGFDKEFYRDSITGQLYVHFAYYRSPVKGDLVLGKTGIMRGAHRWLIGFYVEPLSGGVGGALIREIGSQATCRYSNEEFVAIEGLSKTELLEGEQFQFYHRVLAAFQRGDEYFYRFGGLDFEGGDAVVWVREVFNGGLSGKEGSKPFSVRMTWNKRTSVKRILEMLKAGGYGTHKFERCEVAA